MTHGSLFSGIGGFDLAAEWMGWENIFHCENDIFCQRILNYYWPEAISYGDIARTDFAKHKGLIDIISGGFPCQPFSTSGKRKGTEDNRHLWPAMLAAIKSIQPSWVVGENVRGLVDWSNGMVFQKLQADLEVEGFEVFPPIILPACSVNAPHRRDRVWFVAHSNRQRYERQHISVSNEIPKMEVAAKTLAISNVREPFENKLPEPKIIGRNDGIPVKLDGITFSEWRHGSTSAYGNSIVPQIAYQIFKIIEECQKRM